MRCAVIALLCVPTLAAGCPTDSAARLPQVQLTAQGPSGLVAAWTAADLDKLPSTTLVQHLSLQNPAGGQAAPAAAARSVRFQGVLLRDLLLQAGHGGPQDRAARLARVEAVATDGYRAIFSWGELFNSPAADHVLVVRAVDDQALSADAGPLALRALGDLRPGPRHVRKLCALVIAR